MTHPYDVSNQFERFREEFGDNYRHSLVTKRLEIQPNYRYADDAPIPSFIEKLTLIPPDAANKLMNKLTRSILGVSKAKKASSKDNKSRASHMLKWLWFHGQSKQSEFTYEYSACGDYPQRDFAHFDRYMEMPHLFRVNEFQETSYNQNWSSEQRQRWVNDREEYRLNQLGQYLQLIRREHAVEGRYVLTWVGPTVAEYCKLITVKEYSDVFGYWESRLIQDDPWAPEWVAELQKR